MTRPRDLVDPDLRDVLPLLPDLSRIEDLLEEVRALLDSAPAGPDDAGLDVSQVMISSPHGPDVPALFYYPVGIGERLPAILNIHGGGFVAGSARREDAAMRRLALDVGCAILSIDYRLAPEHPYPAALNDCDSALTWLTRRDDIDTSRLAIRGVSAGGGLAAGLALREASAERDRIAFLLLVYPMLDDRTGEHPHAGQLVWTSDQNRFGWRAYLGDCATSPPPEAAPARATALSAFPATMIATGSIDLFVGENMSFAKALIDAGVPTELHVYPGAFHGFNLVTPARVAQAFERDCRAALARAFSKDASS